MSQIIPNGQVKATASASTVLANILSSVAAPLTSVNELLIHQIESSDDILRERLNQSGIASGKRMRPALLLLSGACFGDIKKTHVAAAAAVELVHVATLVHDDVLDQADERRHGESVNARWDNTTSILTGDFLFSKAFEVGCQSGSLEAMRQIATASCNVCKGEITQNALSGNFGIDEQQYFEIISLKTAELCRCACGLGAMLSECDEASIEEFENFGTNLGIAFQIIDDVLDIVGKKDCVGKTLGTDLINKKATLPTIHCLANMPKDQRQKWIKKLESGDWQLVDVLEQMESSGSIEYSRQTARQHANMALQFTETLESSVYSESLRRLAEFVLERTF